MSALSNFKQGDAVRLKDTVRHAEYRGMCGTVVRVVKSRGVVTIKGDSGKRYDALPENVELIENRVAAIPLALAGGIRRDTFY